MFKKVTIALYLFSISSATLAVAPVANLKVTGSITPPSCKINGQDEIDLEYKFNIDRSILSDSKDTEIEEITKNIEIVCDAETYLGFSVVDHRQDSSLYPGTGSSIYFGLGFFDTNKKIGFYTMIMKNAKVKKDISSESENATITTSSIALTEMPLTQNARFAFASSFNNLKSGKVFNSDITIKPTISSGFKSSWSDENLDGYATIAFSFSL